MASNEQEPKKEPEKIYTRAERLHILNHEFLPLVCRIRGIGNVLSIQGLDTMDPELFKQLLLALGETANALDAKIVKLIEQVNVGLFDINKET